jgi:hypothetical protein
MEANISIFSSPGKIFQTGFITVNRRRNRDLIEQTFRLRLGYI